VSKIGGLNPRASASSYNAPNMYRENMEKYINFCKKKSLKILPETRGSSGGSVDSFWSIHEQSRAFLIAEIWNQFSNMLEN
jgi:hypothetical protein